MPNTLQLQGSVYSSVEKVTSDKARGAAEANGCRMATFTEAVMNGRFIEQSRHSWVFVGPEGAPTKIGWYKVDRKNRTLKKISDNEAEELEWNEKLYVNPSALDAAKNGQLLALDVGYGYYRDGLILNGYYRDGAARVAEVKLEGEKTPVKNVSHKEFKALLRDDPNYTPVPAAINLQTGEVVVQTISDSNISPWYRMIRKDK